MRHDVIDSAIAIAELEAERDSLRDALADVRFTMAQFASEFVALREEVRQLRHNLEHNSVQQDMAAAQQYQIAQQQYAQHHQCTCVPGRYSLLRHNW